MLISLYMNKKEVAVLLQNFAFSEQEADLYLASLSLGKASVSQLAKQVGKNRTAAYFHIKNLLSKGALRETREGKMFRFVAVPPQELGNKLDRVVTDFKSLIPELESLQKIHTEIPIIEVTELTTGYRKIYEEISSLPVGSEFRVMEGRKSLQLEIGLLGDKELGKFFARLVERKIITRALFTEELISIPQKKLSEENLKLIQSRAWDLCTLPENIFPLQQLLFLYGNKAAFLFPETQLVVTLSHKGIVDVLRSTFDALSVFAKRVSQPWNNPS